MTPRTRNVDGITLPAFIKAVEREMEVSHMSHDWREVVEEEWQFAMTVEQAVERLDQTFMAAR
jgi:hypothetical protein